MDAGRALDQGDRLWRRLSQRAGFSANASVVQDNRDFGSIEQGLASVGMRTDEIAAVMGKNWYRFYKDNFTAET